MTAGPAASSWSPDGQWLVYAMQGFLWRQRAEGSAAEQLTDSDGTDHQPDWSPDGRQIAFVRYDGRSMELMLLELAGGAVTALTSGGGPQELIRREETNWQTRPDVSPDGTRLVYASYLGGQWHQLWLLPAAGGYPIPLTYGDFDNTNPRWSSDGKRIAFISNRSGGTSLWVVNAVSGEQVQVVPRERIDVGKGRPLIVRVQDDAGHLLPG